MVCVFSQPTDCEIQIEWTPEKADILWKVIEIQRTRAVDSAGADCTLTIIIQLFILKASLYHT